MGTAPLLSNVGTVEVSHIDAANYLLSELGNQDRFVDAYDVENYFLHITQILVCYFSDINPDELFVEEEYTTPELSDVFLARCQKATLELLQELDGILLPIGDVEYREEFCYTVYFVCAFAIVEQAMLSERRIEEVFREPAIE